MKEACFSSTVRQNIKLYLMLDNYITALVLFLVEEECYCYLGKEKIIFRILVYLLMYFHISISQMPDMFIGYNAFNYI